MGTVLNIYALSSLGRFSRIKKLLLIFLFIGLAILDYVYILAYNGNFYNILFWISILIICLSIIFLLYDKHNSDFFNISLLFLFGLIMYFMRFFSSTLHFHFGDEIAIFQSTKLIYEEGSLAISPFFEITKYYPGIQLIAIILKHTSSIEFFPIAKILVGLIHSFLLIFLYLFYTEICIPKRIAALGTFLYATNPLYIFFHALYSYESLGIFFIIGLLYIISKQANNNKISFSIISLILMAALTITHHLSSCIFIFYLLILSLCQNLYTGVKKNKVHQKSFINSTILLFTLVFAWMLSNTASTMKYLISSILDRLIKIFELSLFGGEKSGLVTSSLDISLLNPVEFVIDTYLYAPAIILLSFSVLFNVVKHKKSNFFHLSLAICGPCLYLLSLISIPTSGQELAIRIWGFVYIGLSFFIVTGYFWTGSNFLLKLKGNRKICLKIVLIFLALILIIGGISIGNKPIHRVPDLLSPKLVGGAGSITSDAISAANWFEMKNGRNNIMTADATNSIIFKGYGSQKVDRWSSWKAFLPKYIDDTVLSYLINSQIDYVIVDRRFSTSLAENGYYYDSRDVYKNLFPAYGARDTLPTECLDKFDSVEFLKFYDNGNIYIYYFGDIKDG